MPLGDPAGYSQPIASFTPSKIGDSQEARLYGPTSGVYNPENAGYRGPITGTPAAIPRQQPVQVAQAPTPGQGGPQPTPQAAPQQPPAQATTQLDWAGLLARYPQFAGLFARLQQPQFASRAPGVFDRFSQGQLPTMEPRAPRPAPAPHAAALGVALGRHIR